MTLALVGAGRFFCALLFPTMYPIKMAATSVNSNTATSMTRRRPDSAERRGEERQIAAAAVSELRGARMQAPLCIERACDVACAARGWELECGQRPDGRS